MGEVLAWVTGALRLRLRLRISFGVFVWVHELLNVWREHLRAVMGMQSLSKVVSASSAWSRHRAGHALSAASVWVERAYQMSAIVVRWWLFIPRLFRCALKSTACQSSLTTFYKSMISQDVRYFTTHRIKGVVF